MRETIRCRRKILPMEFYDFFELYFGCGKNNDDNNHRTNNNVGHYNNNNKIKEAIIISYCDEII